MDYKQLSLVCELMGLNVSYSYEGYVYCYELKRNKRSLFKSQSTMDFYAYSNILRYLKRYYSLQFENALHQLNLK